MAITVGELAVQLEARTGEFRTAIKDAERRVDRFERKTSEDTKKAGLSFKTLALGIAGVATALGGLAAVRFGGQLAAQATQSFAAFEGFEVRLKGLLGSQEGANKALETFIDLSSETPFAVSQIVAGATTLGSVVDGNREELVELTKTAANLAAVTGLSFEQAAENLQRTVAAGIGSADLFRERGVRRLVESIQGIPDLTKIPLAEQQAALVATFGPEALTPFGTAAEDLSKTLAGALSNIGDASDNAKRALGEALAPGVFATAKGIAIPFFQLLERIIKDNADAITDFAVRGIRGVINGLANLLDAGALVLEFFNAFGVDVGDIGDIFEILRARASLAFAVLRSGFAVVTAGAAALGEATALVLNGLGLVDDAFVEANTAAREAAFDNVIVQANAAAESFNENLELQAGLWDRLVDEGDEYGDGLRTSAANLRAQVIVVDQLADSFREARNASKEAADEGLSAAQKRILEIARLVDQAGFEDEDQFSQRILEQEIAENSKLAEAAAKEAGKKVSDELGTSLASSLTDALQSVLSGEGVNFAEALSTLAGDALSDSLNDALESVQASLSGLLGGEGVAAGGEGGGGGLGAGLGAALGIGSAIFAASQSSSSTRAGMVESVVNSTQAVRGLVAGPSSIPIAQVGNAIRDANSDTLRELRRQTGLLGAILGALGGNSLADAVAREFTASPALG